MKVAESRKGVVATGHPEVTRAAADVLGAGGNAFDAALAAGFAACVAEPMFASLGGGGFLLARAASGESRVYDFFVDTPGLDRAGGVADPHFVPVTIQFPASEQTFNVGLGSVAVPGTLAGLLFVHERLARMPLGEVVAPAVRLAREGVVLNETQAYAHELLFPITSLTPPCAHLYGPSGRPPAAGERLGNPDLATFLENLPESAHDLYRGGLARRVETDMAGGQGLLTARDLDAYAVVVRDPIRAEYRGSEILTNPPPSSGGRLIALTLRLLGAADLPAAGFGSGAHLRSLIATLVEVERLRESAQDGDGRVSPGDIDAAAGRLRQSSGGTTHISIADADGDVASMTLSNGEGSGYVVPGTGIQLNNMLGEDDLHQDGFHASPPGQRVSSMMSPSIVVSDGRVRLALGSGGSKRIRSVITQVISNVVDFGMDVRAAVDAPRIHWDGERVQAEPGFPEASLESLPDARLVNRWPERNLYFGGAHAVDPEDGGAGDPRRGGAAVVVAATSTRR